MDMSKQNYLVVILVALLVISGFALEGCYGAIPAARGKSKDNYKAKTEEELKAEAIEIRKLIESKPDLVAEETYTELEVSNMELTIAVVSMLEEEGNFDIYLMDETGMNPRRLTNFPSGESFRRITNNGKRV